MVLPNPLAGLGLPSIGFVEEPAAMGGSSITFIF